VYSSQARRKGKRENEEGLEDLGKGTRSEGRQE